MSNTKAQILTFYKIQWWWLIGWICCRREFHLAGWQQVAFNRFLVVSIPQSGRTESLNLIARRGIWIIRAGRRPSGRVAKLVKRSVICGGNVMRKAFCWFESNLSRQIIIKDDLIWLWNKCSTGQRCAGILKWPMDAAAVLMENLPHLIACFARSTSLRRNGSHVQL